MRTVPSKIPFNYKTIKVTRSRIDKGLLAIPVSLMSLIDFFPQKRTKLYVALGTKGAPEPKNFTPYSSSSRECRIGGMREFYESSGVSDGDDLVVQLLDRDKYRILTEKQFEKLVLRAERKLEMSKTEEDAEASLKEISNITTSDLAETVLSEYYRVSQQETRQRKYRKVSGSQVGEDTPPSLRQLLGAIYDGKCQVSGFGFLAKSGKPYFEIHHIKPELGQHVKNLLLVCPNVHAQFTYARLEEFFDKGGWLRRVRFNDEQFEVKHAVDQLPGEFTKEVHSEQ